MKEQIDWLKQAWIFTRQKKSNSNENMLFWRKTDETIWKPPLSKRTPPPPLSTNPPISETYFHDPPLWPIFKNKNPPPFPPTPLYFRGGGRKLWNGTENFLHALQCYLSTRQKFIFDSFKSVGHLLNDFKVIENYIHPNYLLFVLITLNRY